MAIALNAIRELCQDWIRQDFGPTLEIELRLRNALRELNGDRHRQKYARNEKNEAQTWKLRFAQLEEINRCLKLCAENHGYNPDSYKDETGSACRCNEVHGRIAISSKKQSGDASPTLHQINDTLSIPVALYGEITGKADGSAHDRAGEKLAFEVRILSTLAEWSLDLSM